MLNFDTFKRRCVDDQTLVLGDSLRVMSEVPSGSVDVVVTSPPYNLNIKYHTYDDSRTEQEYIDWMMSIFKEIRRIIKPAGSFFLNISGSSSKPWLPFELVVNARDIFTLQNHISWVKSIGIGATSSGHFKPISGARFTHHNHEHVFHFTESGGVRLDRLSIGIPFTDKTNIGRRGHARDLRCRGNTWFIPYRTVNSKAKKFHHPGTFPIELPLWCIFLHGEANPTVVDPFVGTGSTLIAARMARGRGIGIDIDRQYIETAHARVASFVESAMDVDLNENEIPLLLEQSPDAQGDGGYQNLLIRLQNKLNRSTGQITLDDTDLEQIPRYAFDYRNGGWQNRLTAIFSRSLGPSLGRQQ